MTNPGSISGLVGWWKADVIVGLADGDRVASWSDSSPEGNDATASGSDRPTFKENIINGLPVVRFAGDPEHMDAGLDASLQVTDFSIFVVAAPATMGGGPICNYSAGNDSFNFGRGYGVFLDSTTAVGVKKGSGDTSEELAATARVSPGTGFTYFDGHYTDNSDLAIYDQGAGTTDTPDTPGISYTNVVGFLLGKQLSAPGFSTWLKGDIAELIIYNRQLDASEKEGVRDYLRGKYFPGDGPTRAIWMDTDSQDGTLLYLTTWNPTTGHLYLQIRETSSLNLIAAEVDLGAATEGEVVAKTAIAYPQTPPYNKSEIYVYGRMDSPAGLSGIHHIIKSDDGGATWSAIEAGWGTDYCAAFSADPDQGGTRQLTAVRVDPAALNGCRLYRGVDSLVEVTGLSGKAMDHVAVDGLTGNGAGLIALGGGKNIGGEKAYELAAPYATPTGLEGNLPASDIVSLVYL